MKFLSKLAFLMFLAASCQQVIEPMETDAQMVTGPEFTAQVEAFDTQTKTALQDNSVVWNTGDQITIFQGTSAADKYQIKEDSINKTTGTFEIIAKGNTSSATSP